MTLRQGRVDVAQYDPAAAIRPREIDEAVRESADLLHEHLGSYLADHPDAVLQLTGGRTLASFRVPSHPPTGVE